MQNTTQQQQQQACNSTHTVRKFGSTRANYSGHTSPYHNVMPVGLEPLRRQLLALDFHAATETRNEEDG